jgi:hypothetical protein
VSETLKFLDGMMGESLSELHTCMLGKIKSFDGAKMQADVIPLLKRKLADGREEPMPVVSQAPVMFLYANGFFVRPPLKPGDLVVVVFAEREIDAVLLSGSSQAPTSTRHHGLEDAIVLGGWLPFSGSLPVDGDDDLYVGHKDGAVTITITPEGKVSLVGKEVDMQITDKMSIKIGGDSIQADGIAQTIAITAPKGISLNAPDITGAGVSIVGKDDSQSW